MHVIHLYLNIWISDNVEMILAAYNAKIQASITEKTEFLSENHCHEEAECLDPARLFTFCRTDVLAAPLAVK